jgi:CspA family cold shock protein
MSDRVSGKVKWFSNDRGYGFAVLDEDPNTEEYFIHYSVINMEGYKTLKAKQPISFVLKNTDKGIQAVEIELE